MGVNKFLDFIQKSPTPWHAVEEVKKKLRSAGFEEIFEKDSWALKPGRKYFLSRKGTSLCAFVTPKQEVKSCLIAAAHTDSPGFKLKPKAEYRKENMLMLGLEVYGSPLLTSWLNRDLGIAGRVVVKAKKDFQEILVRLDDEPVVIPQLAVHLDRGVNESGLILNKQDHLAAIAATASSKDTKEWLQTKLQKAVEEEVLGWDLFLYPLEKPCLIGSKGSMLAGYRLDNLCSVYASLEGLLKLKEAAKTTLNMIVFWDHEEIGSSTSQGAASPFLSETLERICSSRENYFRLISQSLMVSIDAGHAVHPNYSDKHEPRHLLLMNEGIVIKQNAQYRYATDAISASFVIDLCNRHRIPFQQFVSRGDIAAGTTIGPVSASSTGMATVDIGLSMLSMHSSRELIGVKDLEYLSQVTERLFLST